MQVFSWKKSYALAPHPGTGQYPSLRISAPPRAFRHNLESYRMNRVSYLAGLAFSSVLLVVSAPASAQVCKPGELRVFVMDSQQAPIFEASVRIAQASATLGESLTPATGVADFESV